MDKQSPPPTSKDVFVLNPFELNSNQRVREKWLDPNFFKSVVKEN